jgi:hypothetical protein
MNIFFLSLDRWISLQQYRRAHVYIQIKISFSDGLGCCGETQIPEEYPNRAEIWDLPTRPRDTRWLLRPFRISLGIDNMWYDSNDKVDLAVTNIWRKSTIFAPCTSFRAVDLTNLYTHYTAYWSPFSESNRLSYFPFSEIHLQRGFISHLSCSLNSHVRDESKGRDFMSHVRSSSVVSSNVVSRSDHMSQQWIKL